MSQSTAERARSLLYAEHVSLPLIAAALVVLVSRVPWAEAVAFGFVLLAFCVSYAVACWRRGSRE